MPPKKKTQQAAKQVRTGNKPQASKHKQSGKIMELFNQVVFRDWCKACGICSAFCPKNVIGRDDHGGPVIERPDDCIGCRFCELHCPDFAITVIVRDVESERDRG